jgi:glycosyltransferase involved in cell wall biosynthesis
MPGTLSSITVIICTRNRADSLTITLDCLAHARRDNLRVDIIVVDNGSTDTTKQVTESYTDRVPIRYVYEPESGTYGKSYALNRALRAGDLGEIIAILDDDMSPHPDWFQAVSGVCARWPDVDLFAGNTYIIWPYEGVPAWARKARLSSWLFSSAGISSTDSPLEPGRWFSGNHFWFRARVLKNGRRFKDIWLTEPDFQLELTESGSRGVASRDAIAAHRVQPALLQKEKALSRAKQTGKCYAWLRLLPYRRQVKQARLLRSYPRLGRLYCLLSHVVWRLLYLLAFLYPSADSRFEHRLVAVERMTTYLELFRAARYLEDYTTGLRSRTTAAF